MAYEPYHHAPVWRGLLSHAAEQASAGGLLSLRALLRGVMLRRSKADVGECGRVGWHVQMRRSAHVQVLPV